MDQKVFNGTRFKIPGIIFSFHLCTHEPETRSGHCQGDSGGPLFLLDSDNRGELKDLNFMIEYL